MLASTRRDAQLKHRLAGASRQLRTNETDMIERGLEAHLDRVEPGRTPFEPDDGWSGADRSAGRDVSTGVRRRLKRELRAKDHRAQRES
jgi:hypothetical protein